MTATPCLFSFDNTYARDLPGFYVDWKGENVPEPDIILFNEKLARQIGLDPSLFQGVNAARVLAGADSPAGASPLAQVYAGHQFGGFSPQLGDGRALLLGEVTGQDGKRLDIQLKGSGRTPFSRGGDGKAVLGPVLREYIIGEAMHALGVPTTRALAAVTTGETIFREGPEPGAVLTRVAASHIRVGTFQFFAARGETDKVRQLADYTIARHDADLSGHENRHLLFFRRVVERQALLVAKWMLSGFVHGVMNTDNTTISGETIDYGPCAFLDAYDPMAVFSSIDHGGRYAYSRQPVIMQWNLARLAEALLVLIDPDNTEKAVGLVTEELSRFPALYQAEWQAGMRAKTGLEKDLDEDLDLFTDLLELMATQSADYTLVFRRLAEATSGNTEPLKALFSDPQALDGWLARWRQRLDAEDVTPKEAASRMNTVNPIYIPRNHKVEEALEAARAGDFNPVKQLLEVVSAPFTELDHLAAYSQPAPKAFGPYRTFCGT